MQQVPLYQQPIMVANSPYGDDGMSLMPQCSEQYFFCDEPNSNYVRLDVPSEPSYTILEPARGSPMAADPTATNELNMFFGGDNLQSISAYDYTTKHPQNWGKEEVILWLQAFVSDRSNGINPAEFRSEAFANLSGEDLIRMNQMDFRMKDERYGCVIYEAFHKRLPRDDYDMENMMPIKHEGFPGMDAPLCLSIDINDKFSSIMSMPFADQTNSIGLPSITHHPLFDAATPSDRDSEPPSPSSRASTPDDMPKSKNPRSSKGSVLWEFVRDLLHDPRYNPHLIKWEDRERGVFKFVKSDQVARLWGQKKNNSGMNYEKMSRAMRYYYRRKILESVDGRRLVYKFGPLATGWRA